MERLFRAHPILIESLLVAVFSFSVLFGTHSGYNSSEAGSNFQIAKRIVSHGELSLPDDHDGIFTKGPNGRVFASHEFGYVVFQLPFAYLNQFLNVTFNRNADPKRTRIIELLTLGLLGPVIGTLTMVGLYLLLRIHFLQSAANALSGSAICMLCSFSWAHVRIAFDGFYASLLLMAVTYCLFRYLTLKKSYWYLAITFVCLGFAIITRLSMVLALMAAMLCLLHSLWPDRKRLLVCVIMAAICLLPFALWQLYYNDLRTGNPLISPVQTAQYAQNNALNGNIWVGLGGLLFSPGKSILVYCPATILSIIVFYRFKRRYPSEAVFVGATSILWILLHAKLSSWYGAWGYGPRLLATIVPILTLPFLVMRGETQPRWFRILTVLLLGWGFVLGLSSMIVNPHYQAMLDFGANAGETSSWIWSVSGNQAVDSLDGALRIINRVLWGGPILIVPGASPENVAASNSVNMWLFSARLVGVPGSVLILAGLLLLATAGGSAAALCHYFKNVSYDPVEKPDSA